MPHTVNLSSPDRVLFPEDGITKGDLFSYYERVAPVLVPHLRDRPFTMKRYPHGITGEVFFQKQAPPSPALAASRAATAARDRPFAQTVLLSLGCLAALISLEIGLAFLAAYLATGHPY